MLEPRRFTSFRHELVVAAARAAEAQRGTRWRHCRLRKNQRSRRIDERRFKRRRAADSAAFFAAARLSRCARRFQVAAARRWRKGDARSLLPSAQKGP